MHTDECTLRPVYHSLPVVHDSLASGCLSSVPHRLWLFNFNTLQLTGSPLFQDSKFKLFTATCPVFEGPAEGQPLNRPTTRPITAECVV